ncbi:hypothetical protein ACHAXS_003431 [Conticribra weissflogii]
MKNSRCKLTDLELPLNCISARGVASLAAVICHSHGEYDSIVRVRLNSNEVGDEGARILASAMRKLPNLKELHLANNNIGDDGILSLFPKLTLTSLEYLDLYGNRIGSIGSTELGKNLPNLSHLKELNLSGNQIDDVAIAYLSKGIAKHSTLKKVCLGFNNIGDQGAEIIADECLHCNNEHLESLNLHNNPNIGERGTRALIQRGLACNYILKEMNIDWVRGADQLLLEEMNMYLELNRAGRRALRDEVLEPMAWSEIFREVTTLSSVYHLVRFCPEMCEFGI